MPLSDYVIEADSLKVVGSEVTLSVGLPWFRAVPISAVEQLSISIDGFSPKGVRVNSQTTAKFFAQTSEWYPQDRVELSFKFAAVAGVAYDVAVSLKISIPNLVGPDGKPIAIPTSVSKRVVAQ